MPKKNVSAFLGEPIIERCVSVLLKSAMIQRVIVTTDFEDLDKISKYGDQIEIVKRPANLSGDNTSLLEVLRQVAEDHLNNDFDFVCCSLPTSAFLTEEIVSRSISKFIEGNLDFLLTVKRVQTSPDKLLIISDDRVTRISNESQNMSHEDFYSDAAQFYILSRKCLMGKSSNLFENAGYMQLPTHTTVDIDYEEDFRFAEFLLKKGEVKID